MNYKQEIELENLRHSHRMVQLEYERNTAFKVVERQVKEQFALEMALRNQANYNFGQPTQIQQPQQMQQFPQMQQPQPTFQKQAPQTIPSPYPYKAILVDEEPQDEEEENEQAKASNAKYNPKKK